VKLPSVGNLKNCLIYIKIILNEFLWFSNKKLKFSLESSSVKFSVVKNLKNDESKLRL